MTRKEKISKHNYNIKRAFEYAKNNPGRPIDLTALIAGKEEIIVDEIEKQKESGTLVSNNWKII